MSVDFVTSSDPVAAATEALRGALRAVLDRDGRARIAVPGGSALAPFVAVAKLLPFELDRLCLTWVDERCVPHGHEDSNRGALHRALGQELPTELALYFDEESPDQSVARVREGLHRVFDDALDVTLLGMGADGHVASLFVGHPTSPGERVRYVSDSPKPPARRVTLTREVLATAPVSILLATGEAKRGALERLRAGDPELPASGLPGLTVFTDLDGFSGTQGAS
ncbi:MAG: 6-phosphogluconolactonase [Sandaracinaceae bacterium]|nr:6-phosphogluconolactonase [Sandaracinaceae bacterium]